MDSKRVALEVQSYIRKSRDDLRRFARDLAAGDEVLASLFEQICQETEANAHTMLERLLGKGGA